MATRLGMCRRWSKTCWWLANGTALCIAREDLVDNTDSKNKAAELIRALDERKRALQESAKVLEQHVASVQELLQQAEEDGIAPEMQILGHVSALLSVAFHRLDESEMRIIDVERGLIQAITALRETQMRVEALDRH